MSAALARLARTRRTLAFAAMVRPIALGLAGAIASIAGASALLDAGFERAGGLVITIGLFVDVILAVEVARRAWVRVTLAEAALWVDAREPATEWGLGVLADPGATSDGMRARLESRMARVPWESRVRAAAVRAARAPLLVLLGVLALSLGSRGVFARGRGDANAPDEASSEPGARTGGASRALAWRVRVVPPAYAAQPARDLGDAARVAALVASTVELRGEDGAPAVTFDGRTVPVAARGGAWTLRLTMPERPGALRFARGGSARLLALEPQPDSAPTVLLRLPARDTVVRAPDGRFALAADVHDDLGAREGRIEYIVSSGEGESFKFRSGVLGARALGGARGATLEATLDLSALALEPGDLVHLRAVARDANPRGTLAASETRTLRVQRRGEADSVALEAAPPPEADKSLLSQRMLIRMTEALVARQPKLGRDDVVQEARRIGVDQKRLRKAVGEVVFARLGGEGSAEHAHAEGEAHDAGEAAPPRTPEEVLAAADRATGGANGAALDFEGDETPVVAINRPLLEAYNAMWEAALSLDVGEPRQALPPMRRALDAIQRARQAERVYLRGKPPAVVVDLARARLAGKDKGAGSERAPGTALPSARRAIAARLAGATVLAVRDPRAAADTLLLLRLEALSSDAALARALGDAADALRGGAGRDATAALVRARRVATGDATATAGVGAWSGAWTAPGRGTR